MKIKDVKTWVVTNGVMKAVNPFDYDSTVEYTAYERFAKLASDPANQPATNAPDGEHDACLFDEPVWQYYSSGGKEWLPVPECDIVKYRSFEKMSDAYRNTTSRIHTRQFMHYKGVPKEGTKYEIKPDIDYQRRIKQLEDAISYALGLLTNTPPQHRREFHSTARAALKKALNKF